MYRTITRRWRNWRVVTASLNSPPRWRPGGFASAETQTAGYSPAVRTNHQNRRSDRSGDPLLQLLLRRGADLARGHLAALEDHQGRDRHHAVFRGRLRALVDVQLHDLDLVAHRAGNLVECGRDHAAGAAPFGPEIDHDRTGRLEHFGFEIGVRNLANGHRNTSFGLKGKARWRIALES